MLTVQITERDVLAAYLAHLPSYRFAPVAGAVCAMLAVVALFLQIPFNTPLAGAIAFAGIVFLVKRYVLLPRKAKRIYRRRTVYHHPHKVTWNEGGLTVASSTNSLTPWQDFRKWRVCGGVILTYVSDTQFHIIPEAAFNSVRGLADFKALLEEKIGRR